MFPIKFPTNKTHPQVQGMSLDGEKEYLINLDLSNLDPFNRYEDEIEICKALAVSNHLKRHYKNVMDSLYLANAIDALDAFADECVERKKLTISASPNNPNFDDSLEDGNYVVERIAEGYTFISIARFHQQTQFIHRECFGRHLSSTAYHWTGKAGFSTIHLDDSSIIRVIEAEPSLEGLRGNDVIGWQLDRILDGKASLTVGGYKEYGENPRIIL